MARTRLDASLKLSSSNLPGIKTWGRGTALTDTMDSSSRTTAQQTYVDVDLLFQAATSNVIIRNMYATFWKMQEQTPTRYFTYVLLLQHGKIYVGSTDNIYTRLLDHFTCSPSSAVWVREYGPPERIVEIVVEGPPDTEQYIYCLYADRFGYHNVRGGGVCKLMLNHEPLVVKNFVPDGRRFKNLGRDEIGTIEARVHQLRKLVSN
jgi:hypothetical protein